MVDGLDGLRHHAVVRRHHEDGDVRGLRAAGAHGGKRLVARGVEEGDLLAADLHGIGADVLGDAARLARGDAGLADVVQQRGLAVVDMAHDGDDRRTGEEILLGILDVLVLEGVLGRLGQLHFQLHAELGADQLRGVEVQFIVDGGDDAQHHQLFDDLAGRLADALREVAHGDRLGGHKRLFDLHRLGTRRGSLLLLLALAANDLVIQPAVYVHALVASRARGALGVVLAHVLLLLGS